MEDEDTKNKIDSLANSTNDNLKIIVNSLNLVKNKTDVNTASISNMIQRLEVLEQSLSNIHVGNLVENYLDHRKEILEKQVNVHEETITKQKSIKKQVRKLQKEADTIKKLLETELSDDVKSILQERLTSIQDSVSKVDISQLETEIAAREKSLVELNKRKGD